MIVLNQKVNGTGYTIEEYNLNDIIIYKYNVYITDVLIDSGKRINILSAIKIASRILNHAQRVCNK